MDEVRGESPSEDATPLMVETIPLEELKQQIMSQLMKLQRYELIIDNFRTLSTQLIATVVTIVGNEDDERLNDLKEWQKSVEAIERSSDEELRRNTIGKRLAPKAAKRKRKYTKLRHYNVNSRPKVPKEEPNDDYEDNDLNADDKDHDDHDIDIEEDDDIDDDNDNDIIDDGVRGPYGLRPKRRKKFSSRFTSASTASSRNRTRVFCDWPGCDYKCRDPSGMMKHKLRHSNERPYNCEFCDNNFKDQNGLRIHQLRMHREEMRRQGMVIAEMRCTHEGCTFTCAMKKDLTRHMKIHADPNHRETQTFPCEWENCEKKYSSKQKMLIHMRIHRGELNPFKMKSLSTAEKPFKCDVPNCTKAFRHHSEFKRHYNRHNGIKRLSCPWPGCASRFVENSDLKKHMKWHVGEKLYVCSWPGCGKRFLHNSNLNLHQRYHQPEPAYQCDWPGCAYATNNRSNLKTHMAKHIKNAPTVITAPTVIPANV